MWLNCKLCILLLAIWCVPLCHGYFDADEVKHTLYDIQITDDVPISISDENLKMDEAEQDEGASSLVLSSEFGQEFVCRLPAVVSKPDDSAVDEKFTTENVTALLTVAFQLRKCLRKVVGWWTYELCHGEQIKQYHVEGKEIVGDELNLGIFETNAPPPETISRKTTLYHSQFYTDGTLCELNSKLRRTEVRYYCDDELTSMEAYIERVDEPQSCQYLITVHVGSLCELKAFIPKGRPRTPHTLLCHPQLTAEQLVKYKKKKEREQKAAEAKQKAQTAVEEDLKIKETAPTQVPDQEQVDTMVEQLSGAMKGIFKKEIQDRGGDPDAVKVVDLDLNLFDKGQQATPAAQQKEPEKRTSQEELELSEFIEQMLFSEPSWLDHYAYLKISAVVYEMEQLDEEIEEIVTRQPYYRHKLRQIRTQINALLEKAKTLPKSAETPLPKASVIGKGWPKRHEILAKWFGSSLANPEILSQLKKLDEELSTCKEDAYVEHFVNDKQPIDKFDYLLDEGWVPTAQEEEEHQFYRFIAKTYLLEQFLTVEPDVLNIDLEMLDILTRPSYRAQVRRLYKRIHDTLSAGSKTPKTKRTEQELTHLVYLRDFFGDALSHNDIYEKVKQYEVQIDLMKAAVRVVADQEWDARDLLTGTIAKPPKPRLFGLDLRSFVDKWLVPVSWATDSMVNYETKKLKNGFRKSLSTLYSQRRIRELKMQMDEITAVSKKYDAKNPMDLVEKQLLVLDEEKWELIFKDRIKEGTELSDAVKYFDQARKPVVRDTYIEFIVTTVQIRPAIQDLQEPLATAALVRSYTMRPQTFKEGQWHDQNILVFMPKMLFPQKSPNTPLSVEQEEKEAEIILTIFSEELRPDLDELLDTIDTEGQKLQKFDQTGELKDDQSARVSALGVPIVQAKLAELLSTALSYVKEDLAGKLRGVGVTDEERKTKMLASAGVEQEQVRTFIQDRLWIRPFWIAGWKYPTEFEVEEEIFERLWPPHNPWNVLANLKREYDKIYTKIVEHHLTLGRKRMQEQNRKALTEAEWQYFYEIARTAPAFWMELEVLENLLDGVNRDALYKYYLEHVKQPTLKMQQIRPNIPEVKDFKEDQTSIQDIFNLLSDSQFEQKVERLREELKEIYNLAFGDFIEAMDDDEEDIYSENQSVEMLTLQFKEIQADVNKLLERMVLDHLQIEQNEAFDGEYVRTVITPETQAKVKAVATKIGDLYAESSELAKEKSGGKEDKFSEFWENRAKMKEQKKKDFKKNRMKEEDIDALFKDLLSEDTNQKETDMLKKLNSAMKDFAKAVQNADDARKPMGKVSFKKDVPAEAESTVKVQLSSFNDAAVSPEMRRKLAAETQKLEGKLEEKLKQAGFDSKGHKVQVKVIAGGVFEDGKEEFKVFDNSEQFSEMIINLLGGDSEQTKEERRHEQLTSGYNFNINDEHQNDDDL